MAVKTAQQPVFNFDQAPAQQPVPSDPFGLSDVKISETQNVSPVKKEEPYDPTAKLPSTDAWAMGREFIQDLSMGNKKPKDEGPQQKSVYINTDTAKSGFQPMVQPSTMDQQMLRQMQA